MKRARNTISLAKNLKSLMDERGLSVSATAKSIGMNKTTLHNYCNGVIPRNLVALNNLAQFFGVSFSDLIFDKNEQIETHNLKVPKGRYELVVKDMCEITLRRVGSNDD